MFKEKIDLLRARLNPTAAQRKRAAEIYHKWVDRQGRAPQKGRLETCSAELPDAIVEPSKHQPLTTCELTGYHLTSVLSAGQRCRICRNNVNFDEAWYGPTELGKIRAARAGSPMYMDTVYADISKIMLLDS